MKRRNRYVIAVIAVVTVALVIGNIVLFNALPKPKRLQQPVEVDYGVSDPQFQRTMGVLMQTPIVDGNRIALLEDGEAIYAGMLEAIDDAEHSITFETYEFWGEEAAGAFASALSEAAERGVAVHALLDFIGSAAADPDKLEQMKDAGVELIRWREPSWYELARFNHRTHRKLLITDGTTGFTGGANVADNWLPDDDGEAYRDNHFRLEGPVVGNLQAAFMENWLDASGTLPLGEAYFPELDDAGELPMQVVNSAPREGYHRIRKMLLYAIAAAEEQITIGTAYFYPDPDFLGALTDASDRGVTVRILVPGDSIDKGFVRHASVNRWEPMLEAGVEIYEYQPSMYHSKLLSIDDQWASIGSTNLDNRSFRINDETNVNVYDTAFARDIRHLVEEDLDDAERYDLERWQDRPWHKRLAGWLTMTIGGHL
ncbi:phospholipase D-like domain-containing protein [Aquisalimonas asiatica]|uniref:Cardiolipin synthase n=1 Tax=Aquisalimonas asiatica TaxID=406100 RepID=A0A1H8V007_9GAMM|nr:phospholipase D-like domain-containing protein [Aquisalimonas asiatica]SEP08830.1 cardiolipin synthase [Aquisalimonas asiatica]